MLLAGSILCALAGPAAAQLQNGQIQGVVTSDADGKPLAGVTVVVSGPALQGEQVEVTGPDGRYIITQLPSGDDYVVRFYLGEAIVERPGVRIGQNKTLTISLAMPLKKMVREVKVIKERAPNIDTATASAGLELNQDVLRGTAVRGRTFESVITLAPGTIDPPRGQGGDIGPSISGSTGNENNFIIDGLNTSDPNTGVIGTELHQYFIKEANIITGGYQAEYGRATGGVVSIITKTGGNEFHGSIFGSVQPYQASPSTVGRLGESLALRRRDESLVWDVGFDLGGYLVKDRVWFYVGFAPTTSVYKSERVVRGLLRDPMTGQPQPLASYECPSYLASTVYCRGPMSVALATQEIDGRGTRYEETRRLYNGIAKIQFNISPDHNFSIGYVASPKTFEGYNLLSPFNYGNITDSAYSQENQVHDVTGRYVGKLFERKLQIDVLYGYHYQSQDTRPRVEDKPLYLYLTDSSNPYSLSDFENIPECQRQGQGQGAFNPCPLTTYMRNGFGRYRSTVLQRHQVLAAITGYVSGLGSHAIKLGFDFEHLSNNSYRTFSGTDRVEGDPSTGRRFLQTSDDGTQLRNFDQYSTVDADGNSVLLDGFRSETFTNNYALYLRDSWNVRPVPGLVLNLGVRWEVQELYGANGQKQLTLYDNIAPRAGVVWDFTAKGYAKLYANYGRFYQSIPLTINDRQFSGEGIFTGAPVGDCPTAPVQPGGRPVPYAGAGARPGACDLDNLANGNQNGGRYGNVLPGTRGQYIDEVTAGLSYDVGFDVVLGVGYIYRTLGNIIEDMSVDGGTNYVIGNPGKPADPALVQSLETEIAQLGNDSSPAAQQQLERKQAQLAALRSVGTLFPRARREYHALVLTATKRLSNRFSIIANYTYSRMFGNYPGTYDATVDENLPNFSSQFDLTDLLANRNGPLPNDRPHNLKFLGTYQQPIKSGTLNIGLTFSAYSGRPINVLGAHNIYGNSQVFILPRGAGGRTPMVTQFDLHVGYDQPLGKHVSLSLFADLVNLFNQRAVTNVDDDYTYSYVGPIASGRPSDIVHLKAQDGKQVVLNSNYGQPTAFQAPLYFRLGARLSF
ncbi:MAG: TonB-dependent receptor [Polyangia bacterium]